MFTNSLTRNIVATPPGQCLLMLHHVGHRLAPAVMMKFAGAWKHPACRCFVSDRIAIVLYRG
jgi:hypothetical protein